ncbi:hypothetical protein MLD38_026953 [Melastoma candidum]|uniref:Uncharacterized protein n=1 Tax=Melastoma candidum TaxID=119954 RepID=A0ACB9NZY9_9MYRT|nr:hypothetical protein MLD38_026953 [Melastoma candidum]
MTVPKVDEFLPHPVKIQLPGVEFCLNSSPRWHEVVILAFQHYLVMLGTIVIIATILVPLLGGGDAEKAEMVSNMLFAAGINTLLQTWFGTRLPVVIGGSFTYLIPTVSIALSNSEYDQSQDPDDIFQQSIQRIQGALIIAGILQMVMGFLGFWRIITRFITPLSVVPFVTLTGLGLFVYGFPRLAKCIEIGLPALVLLVIFSQYFPNLLKSRSAVFERYAVLLTVAFAWIFAELLTISGAYNGRSVNTQFSCRTDRAGLISGAEWIRIPYPFQYGGPVFFAGDAFAAMAAAIVAMIESTGTFIAASRFASATPVPPSVLSRGVGWLGVGTLIDGALGTGNGSTASVENTGLLGLTRIGSRRVVQISAGYMLFFSILGKFGALIASIPLPIVAALFCVLYSYVAAAGLGFLQFCNLNSFRTKFILGFSVFMALSIPQYFNEYFLISGHGPVHTHAIWFNNIMQVIFTSAPAVALGLAYLLDATHSYGQGSVRRDSGRHWFEKFWVFSADVRSEEFYSLPYNLDRFFPSF